MSEVVATMVERLRAGGGRLTAARLAVIEALVTGGGHHVTAADLVERLRRDDPGFHESTVYRTLDRLVALGAVTRIEVDGGPAVYHVSRSHHHHAVCDACGRVTAVEADLLAPLARRLRREHGFDLRADAVTLHGRCTSCDDRTRPDGPPLVHDH